MPFTRVAISLRFIAAGEGNIGCQAYKMNLYFRMMWTILRSFFKPKIDFSDEIVLELRIFPNDLDINRHLNNGRYLTILDLGSIDLFLVSYIQGSKIGKGQKIICLEGMPPNRAAGGFSPATAGMQVRYIGSCCDAAPHHTRAMSEALGRTVPASRCSPELQVHTIIGREGLMKELIPEINIRRANRALSDKKIPDDTIQRIMTAATYAPSCFNNQPWRFLVAAEEEALKKIHDALTSANYWVKKAPAVVIVATKPEFGCRLNDNRDYALFDCGLATENLMLQGFKEGLYAHAIAGFDPHKIKAAFKIPDAYIVATLVALGYPGDDASLNEKHKELEHSARNRKPESEVICYNTWSLGD